MRLNRPYEIKAALDEYVIGQEAVKQMLSIEFFQSQHYDRLGLAKNNMLLIGPTGSGKTYVVEALAKLLKLPFYCLDATSLTPSGYKGKSIPEALQELVESLGERAKSAIVFVDEVDKLAMTEEHQNGFRTKRIQQEFLKVMEGSSFDARNPETGALKSIDTSRMTFIFGGAFVGIESVIDARIAKGEQTAPEVSVADLVAYGLIPEFAGRIPSIGRLARLTAEDLEAITLNSKQSVLTHYQTLFKAYHLNLSVEEAVVKQFAQEAYELNTGARGISQKLGDYLRQIQYQLLMQTSLPTEVEVYLDAETDLPAWRSIGEQTWEEAERAFWSETNPKSKSAQSHPLREVANQVHSSSLQALTHHLAFRPLMDYLDPQVVMTNPKVDTYPLFGMTYREYVHHLLEKQPSDDNSLFEWGEALHGLLTRKKEKQPTLTFDEELMAIFLFILLEASRHLRLAS